MKRFTSLLLVLILLLGVVVGCSPKEEAPPADSPGAEDPTDEKPDDEKPDEVIVMRLAEVHPEGYPTYEGAMEFSRLVEERTNGKYKIEVYGGSQLGDEKSVTEQIQFGAIEFGRLSLSPITEFEKSLEVLMLPYIYRDKDHMFKVVDGEIGDELLAKLEENKLVGLAWYDAGARSFYNSVRDIKTPDDMKGLKIRVQETELMMDLVEGLGASPMALAYADVYSALQTGVIDGAENNFPSYYSTHHFEVAPYLTLDEHTRIPELILTSTMVMDSLTDEEKEIFRQAAKESAELERRLWEEYEKESEQAVIEGGVTITRLESNEEWQEKMSKIYDKYTGYEAELIERIRNTQ